MIQSPVWAQDTGRSTARATMAVSLTVTGDVATKALDGERYVSGKGTLADACGSNAACADVPEPKLVAKGAANSGFRDAEVKTKAR